MSRKQKHFIPSAQYPQISEFLIGNPERSGLNQLIGLVLTFVSSLEWTLHPSPGVVPTSWLCCVTVDGGAESGPLIAEIKLP